MGTGDEGQQSMRTLPLSLALVWADTDLGEAGCVHCREGAASGDGEGQRHLSALSAVHMSLLGAAPLWCCSLTWIVVLAWGSHG